MPEYAISEEQAQQLIDWYLDGQIAGGTTAWGPRFNSIMHIARGLAVQAELTKHPKLAERLPEIEAQLRSHFPDEPFRYEVLVDPDWPESRQLSLSVSVASNPETFEASVRLMDAFENWWLDQPNDIVGALLVDFRAG